MAISFDFKKEWELSMKKQEARLGKKRGKIPSLAYDDFQASVIAASDKHAKAPTTRALQKLQPVLDLLNIFVNSITSLVQASPELAGFIWGAMQAVVCVASRFSKLLSTITDMFEELASIIVQLNGYLTLFPESNELQQCSRHLIDDYVGFTISAFIFFHRWPLYNLLRLFWSTIDNKFEETKSSIEKHYKWFDRTRQRTVDTAVLGNTRKIVEALPTVTILPAITTSLFEVPLLRNPHFSERDQEVQSVRASFVRPSSPNPQHPSACLLQGLGGVGKTTVALEYVFKYRDEYDFVFWIPAETALEVTNTAAALSRKLKLGPQDTTAEQPQLHVERFRSWLEILQKNWLLVLDNVEDLSIVTAVWPRAAPTGHILLTSQKSELTQVCASTVLVNPLDGPSGSRLFLKYLSITQSPQSALNTTSPGHAAEQDKAEMIANELSGIPLAIAFVAGIFSSMSLDEILSTLKNEGSFASIFSTDTASTLVQYEKPFGATWDIAQKQLSPTSLLLARTLSMLAPGGVAEKIFANQIPGLESIAQYHSALLTMRNRHLVDRQQSGKGHYLLMHRLVQKHILNGLKREPDEFQRVFDGAYRLILRVFPKQSPIQSPQNHLWTEGEAHSPHILSLCVVYENNRAFLPLVGMDFAEMLTDASNYFWERGLYREGYQTIDAAMAICERLGDEYAPQKAKTYAISGAIRHDHGISQRSNCQDAWNKELRLRQCHLHSLSPEEATDEEITCWGNAWNDLGCGLIDLGFYEEGRDFFELAWEQRKASLLCQKKYNHIPRSSLNVATALAGMGKHEEAIALMSETVQKADKALDSNSAVAQTVHFTLALVLVFAGKYEEAFPEARDVYDGRTKIFGQASWQTSDAAYLLAVIEQKRGNLERAALILESTLSRLNGWTDEAQARAKYRLAETLRLLGRESEAAPLSKSAKETLTTLWTRYGDGTVDVNDLEMEVALDLLVCIWAGRSTSGQTSGSMSPKLQCLVRMCRKLLERFRGEPDKSPPRLCRLFNLEHDPDWIEWLELP